MIEGYFKDVSRIIQGCFKVVSSLLLGCFDGDFRVFQEFLVVSWQRSEQKQGICKILIIIYFIVPDMVKREA